MSVPQREYLRIPRDAHFPTLPVPDSFQAYASAYYLGAKTLWEKTKDLNGAPYPDNLVYPILFLVHHFLELELKSAIELTYSIGNTTQEITEEQNWWCHDLNYLLSLMQDNLAKLDGLPEEEPLSEPTCQLIEDMAKFGMLGEALRYPIRTVRESTRKKAIGERLPDSLIPDVASVIAAADKARLDLGGLISYLMEYEKYVRVRSEYEQDICSEYEQDLRGEYE